MPMAQQLKQTLQSDEDSEIHYLSASESEPEELSQASSDDDEATQASSQHSKFSNQLERLIQRQLKAGGELGQNLLKEKKAKMPQSESDPTKNA